MPVTIRYLERRLKVKPLWKLNFPSWMSSCYKASIPEDLKTNGIEEKDLVIFVTATNEPD